MKHPYILVILMLALSASVSTASPGNFVDDFIGTGSGVPPGWTLQIGTDVDDTDPTKVALFNGAKISNDIVFDPSNGGSIRWQVDSSGATAGREIQHSVFLLGEGGSFLEFWFNIQHTVGNSAINLNDGTSTTSVYFSSQLPMPATGYEGSLSWTEWGVHLTTDYGIDVFYSWVALGTTLKLPSLFGTQAQVAIQGRPGTAQNFDWVQAEWTPLVDIDGYPDVIFGANGTLCTNDGTASFDCADVGVLGRVDEVSVGDLNGDGFRDILFTNGNYNPSSVCLNDGAGNFSCHAPHSNTRTFGADIGDIDNDGDNDLVFSEGAVGYCLNDGIATFGDASCTPIGPDAQDVELGDLNGDGNLDAVFALRFGQSQRCLGDGTGGFTCAAMAGVDLNDFKVRLGDLDGDGDLDGIFGGNAGEFCFNDGAGNMSCSAHADLALARHAVIADFNGDGHADTVWVFVSSSAGLTTCLGDGSGTTAGFTCTNDATDPFQAEDIAVGDVNGDGDLDVAVWVSSGNNRVCLGDGTGSFTCSTVNDTGGTGGPTGVAIADVSKPSADLVVTKTDDADPVVAGTNLTYTVTVTNNGPADAANVAVTDTLPAGVSLVSTSGCDEDPAAVPTCSLGTILNGAFAQYTITVAVGSGVSGMLTNEASVTSDEPDRSTANNTVQETTVVTAQTDLAVTKDDGVTAAVPGQDTVTYTIVASNAGPSDEPSASLTDSFPAGLTCSFTSAAAGGATGNTAAGAGDLAETLALPAGSSATYTVGCTIDPGATGTLSNTATISGSATDPNLLNNSATDGDTVLTPETDLAVTKTDGVTDAVPGGTVTYTITAMNAGPSDAVGATVADVFAADFTGCDWTCTATGSATCTANGSGDINDIVNIPVGDSVTYSATCTIDATAGGTLSNTATVAAGATDPNTGDNSATDDDTVLQGAVFFDAVTHAAEDETVDVPVHLATAGNSLGAVAFSIDYDESCLAFDPADGNGDGIPDDITINVAHVPADFTVTILYDALDTDGEIDVSIADVSPPILNLVNDDLLTVHYAVTCPAVPVTPVDSTMAFSLDPSATFGDDGGGDVTGTQVDGIVRVWPGPRGDCNGGDTLGAADLTAVGLEIFDGDGDVWFDADEPTFAGSPVGCDANASGTIAAGDVTCVNQLIFGLDCGAVADLVGTSEKPELLVSTASEDGMVWIRAALKPNGHAIGSLAFSLDLGPHLLYAIDANGDGVPDNLRFPGGRLGLSMVRFDASDEDGELDVLLADLSRTALREGYVVEIGVPVADLGDLRFSKAPAPSFGTVTGGEVDGDALVEGNVLFVDGFESGDTGAWSFSF